MDINKSQVAEARQSRRETSPLPSPSAEPTQPPSLNAGARWHGMAAFYAELDAMAKRKANTGPAPASKNAVNPQPPATVAPVVVTRSTTLPKSKREQSANTTAKPGCGQRRQNTEPRARSSAQRNAARLQPRLVVQPVSTIVAEKQAPAVPVVKPPSKTQSIRSSQKRQSGEARARTSSKRKSAQCPSRSQADVSNRVRTAPNAKPLADIPIGKVVAPGIPQQEMEKNALLEAKAIFAAQERKAPHGTVIKSVTVQNGQIEGIEIFKAGSTTETKVLRIDDAAAWKNTRFRKSFADNAACAAALGKIKDAYAKAIKDAQPLPILGTREQEGERAIRALRSIVEALDKGRENIDFKKEGKDYWRHDVQRLVYKLDDGKKAAFLASYNAGTLSQFVDGKDKDQLDEYIAAMMIEAERGLQKFMQGRLSNNKLADFRKWLSSSVERQLINGKEVCVFKASFNDSKRKEFAALFDVDRQFVFEFLAEVQQVINKIVEVSKQTAYQDMAKNLHGLVFCMLGESSSSLASELIAGMTDDQLDGRDVRAMTQAEVTRPVGLLIEDLFKHRETYASPVTRG